MSIQNNTEQLKVHELKIWKEYFDDVESGKKPFEVRKNDRDFKVGDILRLSEWENISEYFTGRVTEKRITYLMDGGEWGLEKGNCILGLEEYPNQQSSVNYFQEVCEKHEYIPVITSSTNQPERKLLQCRKCGKIFAEPQQDKELHKNQELGSIVKDKEVSEDELLELFRKHSNIFSFKNEEDKEGFGHRIIDYKWKSLAQDILQSKGKDKEVKEGELKYFLINKETKVKSKPFSVEWFYKDTDDLEFENGETLPLSDFKFFEDDYEIHIFKGCINII